MNRQGPGKISWTQWTFNPITGCLNGCPWCYARRTYERYGWSFEPCFHLERLVEPLRKKDPYKIFVGSTAEMFGPWVPEEWIVQVLEVCRQADWHTYQFLTKNPEGMKQWLFPDNCWCGVTVTCNDDLDRIEDLKSVKANVRFVSFEPCLERIYLNGRLAGIDWAIFGAKTGPEPFIIDEVSERLMVGEAASQGVAIWEKENLQRGPYQLIQQWPGEQLK